MIATFAAEVPRPVPVIDTDGLSSEKLPECGNVMDGDVTVTCAAFAAGTTQACALPLMPAAESLRPPWMSNHNWPGSTAGQDNPAGVGPLDTSTWFSDRVAPPIVQPAVSSPATSKVTVPLAAAIEPVNFGLMVRPSMGLKAGVSVVSLTVSDQFLLSLIAPDTLTVKAVAPDPSTAVPLRLRPASVARVTVLPDLTVSTPSATTASPPRVPVNDAAGSPPVYAANRIPRPWRPARRSR